MAERSTRLQVNYNGSDLYQFNIWRPGQAFADAIEKHLTVPVRHDTITELCHEINQVVSDALSGAVTGKECGARLRETGGALFRQITRERFEELCTDLRDIETPLLISTNDTQIPWELLHDEKEFLGLRHSIGRCIFADKVPKIVAKTPHKLRCLIIANPTPDLPGTVGADVEKLREWLASRGDTECTYLAGEYAQPGRVLVELSRSPYDIIYYSGHVAFDDSSKEYAFILGGDKKFGDKKLCASEIASAVKGKGNPIVFVKGCESGNVESLTKAFLSAGALLMMGTLFKVSVDGATKFARIFYEEALSGTPVGEALRKARVQCYKDVPDACWASFVMYGDPSLQLVEPVNRKTTVPLPADLGRQDFDEGAWQVVNTCVEYARPVGQVSTVHLLAAMLEGTDNLLREKLREQRLSPSTMREAFRDQFRPAPGAGDTLGKEVTLSENTSQILTQAKKLAADRGRTTISERDVVIAFARHGAGGAGEVLKSLGANLQAIGEEPVVLAGNRPNWDVFDSEVRTAVTIATKVACTKESSRITPWHLLEALAVLPEGLTRRLLLPLKAQLPKPIGVTERKATGPVAETMPLSSLAAEALQEASRLAKALGERSVSEACLLWGLLTSEDEEVHGWLKRVGTDASTLRGKIGFRCILPERMGPTRQAEFDESGRQVMERVLWDAHQTGSPMVGSPHLWLALVDGHGGYARAALRRQGVSPDRVAIALRKGLTSQSVHSETKSEVQKEVTLSDTVVRTLELAKALTLQSNRQLVGERDLWLALTQEGGGSTGRALESAGVVTEALGSSLLQEDGSLDLARCDAELETALREALRCAQEMAHKGVNTTHLMIGLLSLSDGLLVRRLVEQGLAVERVRDALERFLPLGEVGRRSPALTTLHCQTMSPRLLKILCLAERLASDEGIDKIGERHAVLAFLHDGGETAQALRQVGVNLRTLIRSLESDRKMPVLH